MPTNCRECGSTELARRGKYRRDRCKECYNAYQRGLHMARPNRIEKRRELYAKHAEKRREESRITKTENRERYTLLEWFRRHGIPAKEIPNGSLNALVEMKKSLTESKTATKNTPSRSDG